MKHLLVFILAVAAALALPNRARAADPQVQSLGQAFLANLPSDWYSIQGNWQYFSVANCLSTGQSCLGNNPSTPYGYPGFGNPAQPSPFNIGKSEAIVIFLRTPPQMRYFSFTQYLVTRGSPPSYVYGSMSDALNLQKLSTLQAVTPTPNVFNEYAVIVWTADLNTLASVKNQLALQGIQAPNVNFIPLPVQLPLNLGNASSADTFAMVMRTALPNSQAQLNAYMGLSPFFVLKVGPTNPPTASPAPTIGYASEVSGVSENPQLNATVNQLVSNIRKNLASSFIFQSQNVGFSKVLGLNCIAALATCDYDSHDDLVADDLTRVLTVRNLNDVVIVAGVNHQTTGKALYINHSVSDPVQSLGVVAVDDTLLGESSALYYAGVTSPTDPRVAAFHNLYAYAISYNCGTLKYCMNIPAPTLSNPVGLAPGAPFLLWGRAYVDPLTGVRPDSAELVTHQVLVGTHK